jgi:hypothetical protein
LAGGERYKISSVLKRYYLDGEDAYLMIKDEL